MDVGYRRESRRRDYARDTDRAIDRRRHTRDDSDSLGKLRGYPPTFPSTLSLPQSRASEADVLGRGTTRQILCSALIAASLSCLPISSKVQGLAVHLQHSGWLRQRRDRYGLGLDIAINIYERSDYLGGCKLLNSSTYFLGSGPSSSDSKPP